MTHEKVTLELTPLNLELILRSTKRMNDGHEHEDLKNTIEYLANTKITQVKTETAFQLAWGGREVWQFYADGTDSLLDDIEAESEYYPDKSKSYPEIETIFIVEGEL